MNTPAYILTGAAMRALRNTLICTGLMLPAISNSETWESAMPPAPMLELYTSQGCYSCPPAESWLNRFTKNPELWRTIIPMAFHVDYWNYLGWKDPYSHKDFSQRQRRYEQAGAIRQVATPGFVYGGSGWNGWFAGNDLPTLSPKQPLPKLRVDVESGHLNISWPNRAGNYQKLYAHVARLGFGLVDHIPAGENKGKTLEQDFVVTAYLSEAMEAANPGWQKRLKIPAQHRFSPTREALVVWLTSAQNPRPIITVGNWLKD